MDLSSLPTPALRRMARASHDLLSVIVRADDPARKLEDDLVADLSRAWDARSPEALRAALRALEAGGAGSGAFTEADRRRILTAAGVPLTEGWTGEIDEPTRQAITRAYGVGREEILLPLRIEPSYGVTDEHARQVLIDDTLYWVGNAWSGELGASIAEVLQREVIDRGLSRDDAAEELQRVLGAEFPGRSRAYWEVVAAAGVVRTRTFGVVESFVQAGVRTYVIRAVNDARTSRICQHLDGREFSVEVAVRQRDAFLGAEDPEQAKAAQPWLSEQAVLGLSDDDALQAAGVALPPYHGRCRTQVVPKDFG